MNGRRYQYDAAYRGVTNRQAECPDCGAATEAYLPQTPAAAEDATMTFDYCPCGWESGERDFTYPEYIYVEDLRFDDTSGDIEDYYEWHEKRVA